MSSVQESAPDLVIVDVHTPAIARAPSWKAVGIKRAPATIVTAFDPSAVSAFASSAIDFVVKPFDAERLEAALDLARLRIAAARMEVDAWERSSAPEQQRPAQRFLQRLAVEANEKIVLVRVDDIRWMQSSGNHIRLHVGKTSYLIRNEKPPGTARPESFSARASQCDRESRPCRGIPFTFKWQYVRKAERRTLPAPSKNQSSATAKTVERHLVVQVCSFASSISLGRPLFHEIPSNR